MKTIKLTGLLALCLISTQSVFAQVGFGLKGGLNLTTLNVENPELTYNSRSGYHAGIFLRSRFDKVAVQPELLISTQRGEMESSSIGTAQESFTYLSIPVMLKFYPIAGLNIQLGPQFGFLLDGERRYSTIFGSGSESINNYYKSSDMSVSVGGGYDFDFGLSLDARYSLGIKDINDAADNEPVRSRIISISLGWNFMK